MSSKPDLSRVFERPDPGLWAEDELLTLPEAAQLMWPKGPLKTASLRTAARDGQLALTVIAGKHLTTKAALKAMGTCFPLTGAAANQPEPEEPLSARNIVGHIAMAATGGRLRP